MTPQQQHQVYEISETQQLRAEKAQLQLDLEDVTVRNKRITKERDHAVNSLRFQRREDAISVTRIVLNDLFFACLGAFICWLAHS